MLVCWAGLPLPDAGRCIYGVPRVHAGLQHAGPPTGRHRVERLMRDNGVQGFRPICTGAVRVWAASSSGVDRHIPEPTLDRFDEVRVTDMPHERRAGFARLADSDARSFDLRQMWVATCRKCRAVHTIKRNHDGRRSARETHAEQMRRRRLCPVHAWRKDARGDVAGMRLGSAMNMDSDIAGMGGNIPRRFARHSATVASFGAIP